MDLKNKYIIIITIVVIIIAIVGAYAFGCFDFSEKTEFDNRFMSGTFQGKVIENPINSSIKYSEWTDSYTDKVNSIEYNMSCFKNGSILMDIYQLQGLSKPEIREFNGVSWNIYYSQAVPSSVSNNSNLNESPVMNVYICEADNDGASYMIYIVSSDKNLSCDGPMYCDFYKEKVEPLLKSISFKDGSKSPELYDILGIQKSDMKELIKQINQVKANSNI